MKKINKIVIIFSLLAIIFSCSTRKDAFLNRSYNAITAKYNILYNGQLAYNEGLKQIEDKHQDNFWKRLPIEAISFEKEADIKTQFANSEKDKEEKTGTPFDRAEEKAVKAIQRHGMNINGYEKNSQIDDAYLLLGKSRYYTQRFIPAIEAFNYIIANYPNANLNYETRVWRAKSNIRLGNDELAIETMLLLLDVLDEAENVPPRIIEEANTTMAMAYSQTDTISKAIHYLKKATETSYNKEQTGRNMFVLGQIYNELNQKDSARMVFEKLANTRRMPDKYRVHANIELAKSYAKDSTDISLVKRFKKLIRDTDNRKYYDELYYQLGVLYQGRNEIDKAVEAYKKSLKAKNGSDYQKTYTYERLGNIYFNKADYLLAENYYDSVSQVVPKLYENEKRIRRIKRKNKGLTSLKKYEDIITKNDSVLRLVDMSETEREVFFKKHIEAIKKEDEQRRQRLANSNNFGGSSKGFLGLGSGGKWYFYNTQSKQMGKADFKRVWGNRKLEDNWRYSEQVNMILDDENNNEVAQNQSRYKLETYLDAIPTDEKEIKKLKEERNDALYKTGLSYKESFKNTKLAIARLERLNAINTNKDIELPIHYHLYQLYSKVKDLNKADQMKGFILREYPMSKYAELLKSPNGKITTEPKQEDEISKMYKNAYYLYKKGKFQETIDWIDSVSVKVGKSDLIPKFALLKAMAIGKTQSKDEYLKALQFVVYNYADTIEGKKAKEIISKLKSKK